MPSFSVFTKSWKDITIEQLGRRVRDMGFDAIEFPLRAGYQVEPHNAQRDLPKLVDTLAQFGVRVEDVASELTPAVFEGCAKAGIGMIRVMFLPPMGEDFLEHEKHFITSIENALPLCRTYGVKVGLQMHCGTGATNTAEMMRIVSRFEPQYVGAIWDAAHSGLAGECPEQAIDMCYSHLCLVNFKNARWQMRTRGEDEELLYREYMTRGSDGRCSWPRAVRHLKKKGYTGTWCMPAEYDDAENGLDIQYAKRDLAWLKKLVME